MSNLELINYDETFSILNSESNTNYVIIDEKIPTNYIPFEFFETQNDLILINNDAAESIENENISTFITETETNLNDLITNDKLLLLANNSFTDLLNETLIDEEPNEKLIRVEVFQKECKCCNQLFTDEAIFKAHIKDEPYQCEICDKYFTQQSNLWKHIRIHTNEKSFKCGGCDKSFSQRSNMVKHQLGHLNERPFSCSQCNRTFVQEANLNKHLLVHSGEKPFACEICEKRFSQRSNLTKHKLIHSNDKALFTCDICNQSFTQKSNLKIHSVIHNKSGPYFCKFCNKAYNQEKVADKHMLTCKVRQLLEEV